jgi:hypothetical protein
MGMRQDNCINARRIEWKPAVTIPGFIAPAMVDSTVKEKSLPPNTKNVHGAGNCAGSALKLKMHRVKNSLSV